MADKTDKMSEKPKDKAPNEPRFEPKAVRVGGESLLDRLYPHRKKIAVFVVGALVLSTIIAVVLHFQDAAAQQDTAQLAKVLDLGQRPVHAADGSAAIGSDEFASETARATAMLSELAKQDTNLAGPVYRASLLVQAKKFDDAIAEYRAAEGLAGLDGVLAREGLGLAQEQKAVDPKADAASRQKGLEDALATFQTMQPDESGPRRAYALYHQGRLLMLLGKTADSKAAFDKAKELAKDNPELAELVEQRLANFGS